MKKHAFFTHPAWHKMKHTPGPFTLDKHRIIAQDSTGNDCILADVYPVETSNSRIANASRFVACVNALEGLDPGAVRELIEAATQAGLSWNNPEMDMNDCVLRVRDAVAALKVSP